MKIQNSSKTTSLSIIYTIVMVCMMLILLPRNTSAQQYFIKSYAAENGLPTRIITDVCQDKEGYMWFSTYAGISKYDGFNFTNYDSLNGLPGFHYRKIRCDERGIIWAVPYVNMGKIVILKNNKINTISQPLTNKKGIYITSFEVVYTNNKPTLCLGTYSGIDVYHDNKWKHYDITSNKSTNRVYSITKKNDVFYLSTQAGLCAFNGKTLDWSLNTLINPKQEPIYAVSFEKPGLPLERMWILTPKTISYFQNKKITQVADKFLLEDIDLANFPFIGIRKGGDVIFGNNFSKYLFNISEKKIIPLKRDNGFTSNGASSMLIDREENIWFTDSRGVDKVSNISLVNYFKTSGMPENEVTAIVEDKQGRLILGHNNQLSVLRDNKFKIIPFPGPKNSLTRVLDILQDRDGNTWFSANNRGIGQLMPNNGIKWYPLEKGMMSTSVCQDIDGRIWIGTNRKLFYLKNNKIVEYEHNAMLTGGERKLFASYSNGIYASGGNGLYHVDKNKAVKIKVAGGSQDLNVFSYYRDNNGTEFVGTMNGLYYINQGMIKRYLKNGLNISTPVYFILQDRENKYWIGTNSGVLKWDGINDPEVFNTLNGLAGNETNRSASLLDSKGNVWVGTDRGLTCFTANAEQISTTPPKVNMLYAESINGEKYALNKNVSIPYSNNSLSFHFRGISYVNEDLLIYKYKLTGFDDEWREATQVMLDKIKYVGLDPGQYTLCVMAKNNSSGWSKEFYSADIRIQPPFYMSWWFIMIIFIIAIGLLLIFFNITSQHLINRTLKKEISERKLAEASLTESEQRLSFVLEGSRLGTWDWNLTNNVVKRNNRWAEMLGYQPDEIEQTNEQWTDLLHPDDKDKAWADLNDHLEGKTAIHEIEYRIRTKDNKYKWIQDRAMIVLRDENGKPLRMSGTLTDITERKLSAEALKKSEERLRLIMASLPVAIYISPVNPATDMSMITGNVKSLTGFTKEELLSEPDFWSSRIHPFDLHRVMDAFKTASKQCRVTVEYRWRIADNTYKWFHDQSILKRNGSIKEFMGVFIDIDDRKKAEQEIKNKNEQLQYLNAEKDKLFSIISHDLRSPVNGFLGLTSLLADELEILSTNQLKDIAHSLNSSASKVNDLLNDLLEWSSLQRGITIFKPVPLNLKRITDECIYILSEQAKAKNIGINNLIAAEMEIEADVHMLQVVVRNLLTNALKFTPKGGSVIIEAVTQSGKSVKISVSDTGIGMSPELNHKLFKINEKTSRKGTDGEPSSGLGLILCREFVEKQNGQIWAESMEGAGSIFHFTIPIGRG